MKFKKYKKLGTKYLKIVGNLIESLILMIIFMK